MADATVTPLGGGWYLVSDGSSRSRVAVAVDGDRVWAFADGVAAEVDLAACGAAPAGARARRRRAETGVMAPMPATVVAIHASADQAVAAGDTLIVLEAMKMELPIRAPRDGVVRRVACAVGELVQPGVHLLEFDE